LLVIEPLTVDGARHPDRGESGLALRLEHELSDLEQELVTPEPKGVVRTVGATAHAFADDGTIPNNPTLPFLVYPGALDLPADDPAAACEAVFEGNGWGGSWRNGIYPFAHYHSTAHEVLGICRGEAKARFGGNTGLVLKLRAGDVVLIPAGVGHQNLGASDDFLVVGAYPRGQRWDLCRGLAGERPQVLHNIARVRLPAADPVYGADGPLIRHWRGPH
jgi:uncharacterized protein YjlB